MEFVKATVTFKQGEGMREINPPKEIMVNRNHIIAVYNNDIIVSTEISKFFGKEVVKITLNVPLT